MLMRMIYDDSLAQAAYLIGCQQTGEAIIIDPERDIDRYIALAQKEGLTIVGAAETHIHADFLSGVRAFCEQTKAVAYLSGDGGADWQSEWVKGVDQRGKAYNHRIVHDGEIFKIGNIQFKVMHTPGHTPEHICFEVSDQGGDANEPMGILSGDFVFVGDVGRPDLLESAAGQVGMMEPSARQLGDSLRKFQALPDFLQVWPGHGAGSACGKSLGAVPGTTVGYEKRFNTPLRLSAGEDEFVRWILSGQPEPPFYFARMKRDNRKGVPLLGTLPNPPRCTPDSAPSGAVLIDTRPWGLFCKGHLPGSLSIVPDKFFSTVAGAFIEPVEQIVLIEEHNRVEEAVRMLIRIGLDQIVGWIEPTDVENSSVLSTTGEVSVDDVARADDAVVLDVRNASEFEEGHIPGAANIAYLQLSARLAEMPECKRVYVNCQSGFRSARAVSYLNEHGYDATNIVGGFLAWQAGGHPIEKVGSVGG